MYPLIEIKTVPIEIQVKTKHASMEYTRGTAEMEISRSDDGGLNIKSRPIQLQIDTFEARNSYNPTVSRTISQNAQAGKQAAYEATATYSQHGQLMLDAKLGENMIAQFARESVDKDIKTQSGLDFIPDTGAEVDWEEGDLQIRYEMGKVNLDWKIEMGEFKFTPGDIELIVSQKPSVTYKYVGGPIYVPASADPNYEPVDVKV